MGRPHENSPAAAPPGPLKISFVQVLPRPGRRPAPVPEVAADDASQLRKDSALLSVGRSD